MYKTRPVQIHLRSIPNYFRPLCILLSTLFALAVWSPVGAATPLRAPFQPVDSLLDPQIREIIQTAVESTGAQLRASGYGSAPVEPAAVVSNTTVVTESTVISISEPVLVEIDETSAQTNPRIAVAPVNPSFGQNDTALAQHAAQGVSIRTPSDWQVTSNGPNSILTMSVPDVNFLGAIQGAPTAPFPQATANVLLRDGATTVLSAIDPAAAALGLAAFLTDQQLLVTKIGFTATFEGDDVTGALYIASPGATAYLFLALAPQARWRELEPTVDAVVQSMIFDDALMTWRAADTALLPVAVDSGTYTLTVPSGWRITDTADDNWRAVLMAPSHQVAGAVQFIAETPDNSFIDSLFAGDLNRQTVSATQELRAEVSTLTDIALDTLEGDIGLTPAGADGNPDSNTFAARLVGEVAWNGDVVDAVLYLYPVQESYIMLLVLGDPELIVQQEDDLMTVFNAVGNAP